MKEGFSDFVIHVSERTPSSAWISHVGKIKGKEIGLSVIGTPYKHRVEGSLIFSVVIL
jgi:hypothetical protein